MKFFHFITSLLCLFFGCSLLSAQGTKYIYVSSVDVGYELSADGRLYSFVHVPSGTFTMGAENDDDAYAGEFPPHEVTVAGRLSVAVERPLPLARHVLPTQKGRR